MYMIVVLRLRQVQELGQSLMPFRIADMYYMLNDLTGSCSSDSHAYVHELHAQSFTGGTFCQMKSIFLNRRRRVHVRKRKQEHANKSLAKL